MNLIFLGAPGAGKGTQAEKVCAGLGIPAVSTGNILREAVKNQTEAGLKAKSFMDSGQLVPDDVVIGVLKERISRPDAKNGFVLDGFPRTAVQADALRKMGVDIDLVINIDVPDESIIKRMSGRRVCEKCGASFHVDYNPPPNGVCGACGGNVIRRDDDAPGTVLERLRTYHEKTAPLIDYYKKSGKLKNIYGNGSIDETASLVSAAVENTAGL
jgi:adenylate kinase